MIKGRDIITKMTGPYLDQKSPRRVLALKKQYVIIAKSIASVTTKEMVCPRDRAAAVTVPPTSGMTRAGQHQAPMRAGIDKTSVKIDTTIDARFSFFSFS